MTTKKNQAAAKRLAVAIISNAYKDFLRIFPLKPCRTQADYEKLLEHTNFLVDIGAAAEKHKLYDLYDTALDLLAIWEHNNTPAMENVTPRDLLKYLMAEHNLKQKDLADCASQSTLSAFLNGKRGLSKEVAKKLAKRFSVSVEAFLF
jgi:HTH-type transcriptional regulator/antitoxin HigA